MTNFPVSLRSILNQEKEELKRRSQEKEIETKNEEDLLCQVAKMGLMDELTLTSILSKFNGIVSGVYSFCFQCESIFLFNF